MIDRDDSELAHLMDESLGDDPFCEDELISFEELDFELELALGCRSVLQAADRLLRAEVELADAPFLLLRRNRPEH